MNQKQEGAVAKLKSGNQDSCEGAILEAIEVIHVRDDASRKLTPNEQGIETTRDQIISALRRLTEEGGGHNFIIVIADETKNYYVQFGTCCGSAVIYGEAVSDRYLSPPFTLTRAPRAALLSLGWSPPTRRKYPNFWRHWPVII